MPILKRFLTILLAILTSSPCTATEISYRLEKSVNSSWEHSYAVNYTIGGQYQAYLNTKAVFLAPRSDPFRANHEYLGQYQYQEVALTKEKGSGGTAIVYLAASNTLRIKVVHNQGAAVNTETDRRYCYFHIHKIS